MSATVQTNALLERLRRIQAEVEALNEPIKLCAYIKPLERIKWDLIVAASWSDADFTRLIEEFAPRLTKEMTVFELMDFGAVISIKTTSPLAVGFSERFPIDSSKHPIRIKDEEIGDIDIDEGWILTARP
jgi:hypothetical protein